MNYQKIYDNLMSRASNRILTGYTEKHHILPRCMGGTDNPDNLVDLTYREHLLAHMLLSKIHPNHRGLRLAVRLMGGESRHSWLSRGVPHTSETRAKIGNANRGLKRTPEMSKAQSDRQKGIAVIECHTDETKAKIAASRKGKPRSEETKAKIAATRKQRNIPAPNKGKKHTPEARAKISAKLKAAHARRKAS